MLQLDNKRDVTIVAGLSGTGKSTFGLRYLANADLDVRFLFDPEGEYEHRLKLPAARTGYDLTIGLCRGWVLFDPHTMFAGRLEEAFAFFCEWAYEKSLAIPGRKLLVVDEAWKYITTQRQPVELACCVQSGRKRGLATMFNTQNPNLLYSAIRNECSELVCFKLEDDKPLDFVRSKGMNADEVQQLQERYFVARNLDTRGELRGYLPLIGE